MAAKRASAPDALPKGFLYHQNFLTEQDHADLLRVFESLPFEPFDFHGYIARRRIVEYGWEYDFSTRHASATKPLPDFLLPLRERAAAFAGIPPQELVASVITEYTLGAPIGWHRDVPQFEIVIGISLGGAARMRFKPYKGEGKIISVTLEPRSIYVISGAARWNFQHSIPAVAELRYSITFRSLRMKRQSSAA